MVGIRIPALNMNGGMNDCRNNESALAARHADSWLDAAWKEGCIPAGHVDLKKDSGT